MRHRGPDDEGYVFGDTRTGRTESFGGEDTPATLRLPLIGSAAPPPGADVVLAARRLAIQDLSPSGHQPMANADGSLRIAYNGEVYNFRELRLELEAAGHRFHSGTDTEVVLRAYEEWGAGCLDRFNGMWAFAVWDARSRRLFLSRDRYGVKPLHYVWNGSTFTFASEIKALLAYPGIRADLDEDVLDDYLAFGLVDHSDRTFFAGIATLPPGHTLELVDDGAPKLRPWYTLPHVEPGGRAPKPEEFADLLEDAVGHRLIGDVPVGTCLSGGLDSSAIVCVVDRLLGHGSRAGSADRQLTFSARYDDPRHDEGSYIQAVVDATAVDAHETYPTAASLVEDVTRLVHQQDEPFWSTSIYAQWLVFRLARENGVVVTLDGQGGDEVAGGYTHYFGPTLASLLRSGRPRAFAGELAALRRVHGTPIRPLALRTSAALAPLAVRRRLARSLRRPSWLKSPPRQTPERVVPAARPRDPLTAQIHRDITIGLRPLLRVADRNSMAHSVESRLPFLDYRLLEMGYTAPASAKIRGGTTKILLREGLGDVLPSAVRDRQSKIGFSTPEDAWFRGALRPLAESVIGSASFRGRPYFDLGEVERTFAAHLAGANRSLEIWRWLNTELWLRRFID